LPRHAGRFFWGFIQIGCRARYGWRGVLANAPVSGVSSERCRISQQCKRLFMSPHLAADPPAPAPALCDRATPKCLQVCRRFKLRLASSPRKQASGRDRGATFFYYFCFCLWA
jgi:hypothetical protein